MRLHNPAHLSMSTELISSLNRRLDQLHNQASRAQDEAGQRRQRAAVLEAQNELLNKDNQRLLHESTDHAAARYRLEAERDTQQRLSSQQHDDDVRERARLHAELSAIQGQLADSQKQLTEEQASHRHSFTVQGAADDRLAKLQEDRDKLQQDLSRQLANSEAKVAALHTAVQKGEERAASLELQLNAKATPASGADMSTDVQSNSKEAELLQTVADLRKDLQQAQQQAAREAGHVAQFRSLAESAEENTKTVQEQVANLKSEAAQAAEQLRQAKSKTEDAEKDLNATRQSAYEDSQTAIKDKQQAHTTITNLQAELVIARRHATSEAERYQKIVADLATVNNELKQAQSSYNKSVLEHAETVKKLSEQETRVTRLQQEQAAHETAVELAHRGKAAADQAWQQERSKLQTALQAAQQRLHDLERVNAQLQVHLETQAREAAGQAPDEGSKLAGLVQYLQKRLRTLESENTSLEQLSSRLRTDLEAASKRATQADQARLETAEKLRNSLRSQEDQEQLMHQVQETNLLRESNVTLRSMSEQNRKEKEAWSRRAQDAEAQAQPLKRRVQELEAVAESDQQNVDYLKEQVQSGQRRIAELLHKATAVDKEEYDRVVQESDTFRNKLSSEQAVVKELTSANTAAQSSLATVQAEVTRLTAAAKADQDNLRTTQAESSRLRLLANQAESMQASVASLETELRTKAATIEKNKSQVKVALGLVASVNPEGLSSADWKIDLTQKLQERIDLQQQRDKLQQASIVLCIPASCADLESDNAQLKADLSGAQAEMSRTSTANASSQDQQQQQQAELAKVQGAEQSLHLQVTSLTHELKQKNSRLEGLSKDKQQAEEQLAKLSAELGTVKAQLEGMAGAVRTEGTAPHDPAATTSSEQELLTRQPAVEQAEAALHTQQQQLSTDKQELEQHQQSLTASRQQIVEQQQQLARREQQVQEREEAYRQKAGQLDEQKSQLQAQEGATSLAAQEQGQRQEASSAQVQQIQKRMTDLEKIVRTRNSTIERFKLQVSQMRTSKVKAMDIAKCTIEGKAEVVKALEHRVKIMEEQLTQAGLAVPEEVDTKSVFETARDKCMAEKAKLAADEKAEGQASPGAAPKAVTAAKPAPSSAADDANAAAPGADAAEIEAVRLAALASMNKQAGGAPDALGSKQAAGVTPMLRLRPTVVQQGGKRERNTSPSAPASIQAQTGGDLPPAKRVRAPTPVEDAPSAVNAALATLPAGSSAAAKADAGGAPSGVVADSNQQQLSAASLAPPAAQQHVARVAVAQHDPDHVQVNIELPTALVDTEDVSHQQNATQPAPSAPAEDTGHNASGDVDMTEAAAGGSDPAVEAKSIAGGEEAEDGELPGADDNVATGSQAQGTQNLDSSGAASAAGQTDGSDGDGADPAARKPRQIVFALPTPTSAPSEAPQPSAPATAAQHRGGRAPTARGAAPGRRGGTAAGRSVASAARGGPSKGRGRGRH
ncbi:MAG: hypothetical protein FRX49_13234 [Trebouxia sp. A1-2]|nr:MAG: hypothetical protein FRX49_13234 [Trebouxia sp. A1-2]